MITISLQIKGWQEFGERARAAHQQLDDLARQIVLDLVLHIEAGAKRRVPAVTGRLRSSLGPAYVSGAGVATIGHVGSNVVYARAVEYGFPVGYPLNYRHGRRLPSGGRTRPYVAHSKGRRPKPYLVPAADEVAREAQAIVNATLERYFRRLAFGAA